MQKLDCRIPNWITFLELMSYFPRLSWDLEKNILQHSTHHYQFFNTQLHTSFYDKKETNSHNFFFERAKAECIQLLNVFYPLSWELFLGCVKKIFFWLTLVNTMHLHKKKNWVILGEPLLQKSPVTSINGDWNTTLFISLIFGTFLEQTIRWREGCENKLHKLFYQTDRFWEGTDYNFFWHLLIKSIQKPCSMPLLCCFDIT